MTRLTIAAVLSVWILGLGWSTNRAAVTNQPRDAEAETAVKAKVDAALAAVRAGDLDKAMAGWPAKAPGRASFHAMVKGMIPPEGIALKMTDLEFYRWKVGEKELTSRFRFTYFYVLKDGKEVGRNTLFLNAQFTKTADGWQWARCSTALMDTVDDIVNAKTRDEALRILQDNTDLPVSKLATALYEELHQALAGGQLGKGKLIQEVLVEAARTSKDATAQAFADFARGRVLRELGRPGDAAVALKQALDRFADLPGWWGKLMVSDRLVEALLASNQIDQALEYAKAAVKLAREVKQPYALARALMNYGVALRTGGLFPDSAKEYREGLSVARDGNLPSMECGILIGLGEVEHILGNHAEAGEVLEAALKLALKLKSKQQEAFARSLLARLALGDARYDDALAGHRKAADLFRDVGDLNSLIVTDLEIGNVFMSRGQFEEALSQYKKVLERAKADGNEPFVTAALINIANAEHELGRIADAFSSLVAALDRATVAKDFPNLAKSHNSLGNLYFELGQNKKALDHWLLCTKIAAKTRDKTTEARARLNMGSAYLRDGASDMASQVFVEAQKLAREACLIEIEVSATANLAQMAFRNGEKQEAIRRMRDVLDKITKKNNSGTERHFRYMLGGMLLKTGDLDAAAAEFSKVNKSAEAAGDVGYIHSARTGLGDVAKARKQWKDAIPHYQAAIAVAEHLRRSAREPELQVTQFDWFAQPYTDLAVCLKELGQEQNAFTQAEAMKARTLAEILQNGRVMVDRGIAPGERETEKKLLQLVTEKSKRLEADAGARLGPQKVDEARKELNRAQDELDAHRQALNLKYPEVQTARAAFAPADLKQLGETLFRDRPGLVVLSYLVSREQTLVFVLTAPEKPGDPARLAIHKIAIKQTELAAAVIEYIEGCEKPGLSPNSDDLVKWLLTPAEKAIASAKELVIVPDHSLLLLPFQALRGEDKKYLIERCPVSYAPSVTALVKMTELADRRRKERVGAATMLALGISDFGTRGKPLPEAEPEARAVENRFKKDSAPVALLVGADATKAKVRAAWAGRRYLHFATHGDFNATSPLYSSIMLSPDGMDEGRLYARDLLDTNLKAELVVLSACQTGTGRVLSGEGLLGMSWSWFIAGTPSLVVSQWSVSDKSTAKLMREFYDRLLSGATKAEALRQAQLALLKDNATRHPYYWAPFVLVGDARE